MKERTLSPALGIHWGERQGINEINKILPWHDLVLLFFTFLTVKVRASIPPFTVNDTLSHINNLFNKKANKSIVISPKHLQDQSNFSMLQADEILTKLWSYMGHILQWRLWVGKRLWVHSLSEEFIVTMKISRLNIQLLYSGAISNKTVCSTI